ncbi:GDP-mannose 4,6-dehydratase, partial [Pseudomonas guariconensis]
MKILVTGAAGFIGYHLSQRLIEMGYHVIGIDNLNDYYDVRLKEARLAKLNQLDNFQFEKIDITDSVSIAQLFADHRFDRVIHLAAQPGVRYSIENPMAY